jgi:DNA-binding NarL/FixJ family response regulator
MAATGYTAELTSRDHQILSLVAQGCANKDISALLDVSVKTVDYHRTNLMPKPGTHSMAELLAFALRTGLLDRSREVRGRRRVFKVSAVPASRHTGRWMTG